MEKARNFVIHKLQKIKRDYSDQDLADRKRILRDEITPEDRENFRLDAQKEVLGGDHPNILRSPVPTKVEITHEVEQDLARIDKLPDVLVDIRLKAKAAEDLSRWNEEV